MLSARLASSPSSLEAALFLSPSAPTSALTSPAGSDIGLHNPLAAEAPTLGFTYIGLSIPSPKNPSMSGNNSVAVEKRLPTASISRVLSSSSSKFVELFDVYPVHLSNPSRGVGLGLGLTSPLSPADAPSSPNERIIPIVEVAPGSIAREYYASKASNPEHSSLLPPPTPRPPFDPWFSEEHVARSHLSSTPEDSEINKSSPSFKDMQKDMQRAELGLGMPSDLHAESKPAPSKVKRISHIPAAVRDLFRSHESPVRASEARSRAVAAEERASRRVVPQQPGQPTGEVLYTSNATRLAAQAVLCEERKYRRKQEKKARRKGQVLPPKQITPALRHIMLLAEEPAPESGFFETKVKKNKTEGRRKRFLLF